MKQISNIYICLFCFFAVNGLNAQNAELDSLAFSVDLSEYVITAQHAPTHYTNALHNVQVLKAEEFQKRGFTQLSQALSLSSSIRLTYDPILGSTIKIRGIESNNVTVLQDGVPVVGRLDGAIDLSQISLTNVERIEIVEGPQSLMYGNNALGGVINIISKKSQLAKIQSNLDNQLESTGLRSHQLRIGANLKDFHIAVHGKYLMDQPFADDSLRIYETVLTDNAQTIVRKKHPWNPKEQLNFGGLLRYNFGHEQYLMFRYDQNQEDVRNLGELRRPQFEPYAFDEKYKTNRSDYALHYANKIKAFNITGTFGYNDYDRQLLSQRYEFTTESIDEQQTTIDTSSFDAAFLKMTLASSWDKDFNFLFGAEYNYESGSGERIELINGDKASSHASSIFADLKYSGIKNMTTSIGARAIQHSSYGTNVSPTFQTKWKVSKPVTIRAGYARGYRSPGLKELFLNFVDINHNVLGNSELEPETANDLNLSVNLIAKISKSNISATLKMYRSQIDNKIILSEYQPAQFQYENLEQYAIQGIGLDATWQYGPVNVSSGMNLGYWYNSLSENSNSPKYNQTIDASNQLNFSVPKSDLSISLFHRFVGELPTYYMDLERQLQQSITASYHLLDVSMDYALFKNSVHLTAGVRNIFNMQRPSISNQDTNGNHALDTNTTNQLVDKGRTFFVGLSMEFCK